MKVKRRNAGVVSAAGGALLLLLAAAGTAAAAERSRGNATPPAGSGGSVSRSPSVSSSSSSRGSSTSSSGRAADTRPGNVSGGRITRDSRSSGHRSGHHHFHHRHPYGFYYPFYSPYHWGFYGHWGWWGWPSYTPYDAYWWTTGYARVYPNDRYGRKGALDLDVRPEKAEVYLDGQYIGRADDFDGFPTYLWLDQGTYDVVFYHPGRRTLARQYTVYAGLILDVGDRLEPGEAVRPEDLPARSTVNRDARLRRDRDREAEARRMEADEQGWRERYDSRRGEAEEPGEPDTRQPAAAATLHLDVAPGDASVYLDGRFVGTGEELSRRASGLVIDAGEHRLEVVRPGHRPATRRFSAASGEDVELEVELEDEDE